MRPCAIHDKSREGAIIYRTHTPNIIVVIRQIPPHNSHILPRRYRDIKQAKRMIRYDKTRDALYTICHIISRLCCLGMGWLVWEGGGGTSHCAVRIPTHSVNQSANTCTRRILVARVLCVHREYTSIKGVLRVQWVVCGECVYKMYICDVRKQ